MLINFLVTCFSPQEVGWCHKKMEKYSVLNLASDLIFRFDPNETCGKSVLMNEYCSCKIRTGSWIKRAGRILMDIKGSESMHNPQTTEQLQLHLMSVSTLQLWVQLLDVITPIIVLLAPFSLIQNSKAKQI